jgi:oxygen-independent coproporphyrinogen-3 oxidase
VCIKPAQALVRRYLQALVKELRLLCQSIRAEKINIREIFFGGGTPSFLSPQQLEQLLQQVNDLIDIKESNIVTFEVKPNSIDREKYSILKKYGIKRISIGIQSFSNKVLREIKRNDTIERSLEAIREAREAGFEEINIDLINGLPGQSLEVWESTLRAVDRLMRQGLIDQVTIYPLQFNPRGKFHLHPSVSTTEEILIKFLMAREIFLKDGRCVEFPIFFFRTKEYWKRIVSEKSKEKETAEVVIPAIGLGNSAYSFFNDAVYMNIREVAGYVNALLMNNRLPRAYGGKRTRSERVAEEMIFGIKGGSIDAQEIYANYRVDIFKKYGKQIGKLNKFDLIEIKNDKIRLTQKGKIFNEEIMRLFFDKKVLNDFERILHGAGGAKKNENMLG